MWLKGSLGLVLLLGGLILSTADSMAAGGPIWAPDLQSALQTAKSTKRWVLVVVYDTTVGGQDCRATLNDPGVQSALSGFVVTKLSADSGYAQQLKDRYGLWSAGCLLLFRPNGVLQSVDNGTPPPGAASFIGHMNNMIQGKNLGGALKKK